METIVLLEDDSANRSALSTILQLDGYSVAPAETGREALQLCRTLRSIDLLIADVGLPGMSGTEAALQAVELRPELGVLFISGSPVHVWRDRDQMNLKRLRAKMVDFIEKPFLPAALREKVRNLLRCLARPLQIGGIALRDLT